MVLSRLNSSEHEPSIFMGASNCSAQSIWDLQLCHEQSLGALAHQLSTTVSMALEAATQSHCIDLAVINQSIFAAFLNTLGQALDQATLAIATCSTTKSSDYVISHAVRTLGGVLQNLKRAESSDKTAHLAIGQSFSFQQLKQLQNDLPINLWQIFSNPTETYYLIIHWHNPVEQRTINGTYRHSLRQTHLQKLLIQRALHQAEAAFKQIEMIANLCEQQAQLVNQKQELERANQRKSQFLADTSHEIRTPLCSILGFTHLLKEQGYNSTDDRQQEYLSIILSSGQHLLALINDILDLSKVEANQLDILYETVELHKICQTSLTLIKEKAREKDLQLRLEIAPEVDLLLADPLRLKQMLFNLLSNAVKFTQRGTVGVRVNASESMVHLTVWDTGIGIPSEKRQMLFCPYAQLDDESIRQGEGTGLGLALTQKLVELHGGSITVFSRVNYGTQFTISLPKVPACSIAEPKNSFHTPSTPVASDQTALYAADPEAKLPILLVEDNTNNARLVTTYLNKLGYSTLWVTNEQEMWQTLERSQPALILMDVCLPYTDGLSLIQKLRATPEFQSLPIIAQTAMAMAGDRETCLAAGANAYLTKPFDLDKLAHLVAQFAPVDREI